MSAFIPHTFLTLMSTQKILERRQRTQKSTVTEIRRVSRLELTGLAPGSSMRLGVSCKPPTSSLWLLEDFGSGPASLEPTATSVADVSISLPSSLPSSCFSSGCYGSSELGPPTRITGSRTATCSASTLSATPPPSLALGTRPLSTCMSSTSCTATSPRDRKSVV